LIEGFEGFEVLVDDGFVDERPEAFGGLQLGTVGRQEDQGAVRDGQAAGAVPAGVVGHEDDDAIAFGRTLRVEAAAQELADLGGLGVELFAERFSLA
jgi:hypothetical protein